MVLCKCLKKIILTYFTLPCRGLRLGLVGLALYLVDWPTIVLQCLSFRTGQGHCGTCRKTWCLTDTDSVLLWWDPNDVPHRRILPSYEAERWSVPASLCWWCCYCLADQLWVLIAYARRRRRSAWHCCLGHLMIWPVKIVPNMTYNVFDGTLNPTLLYYSTESGTGDSKETIA